MRHRKSTVKLGRTASHRNMMLRNMVTSLFEHGKIRTTLPKAKAARPLAEKMLTLAKRGDLHARRLALSTLTKKEVAHKLFDEIKDKYTDRAGGYTSIAKTGVRRGDAAPMAVLFLIDPSEEAAKAGKKKSRRRRGGAKKTEAAPKAKAKAAAETTKPAPKQPAAPAPEEAAVPEQAIAPEETPQAEASPEETPQAEASGEETPQEEPEAEPTSDQEKKPE
jgi:large subunit ribosomal protein L17